MNLIALTLVVIAFVLTLIHGITNGKVPLWIPLLLVCIVLMVPMVPK